MNQCETCSNLSPPVSLSLSFSPRFTIPESAEIDTVLGNLTVFEYLENKVGIWFSSFAQQSRR